MSKTLEYENLKRVIESCHLNFLIGAGLSSPYLSILGNIESLLTSNANSGTPKKIIEASIKKYYFDNCVKGNLALLDTTYCEKGKESELEKVTNDYTNLIKSLQLILINRESNIVSKQVNLFTTNMDIFLDKTIEELGYVLNDGFYGRINPTFGTENFHNSIHKYSSHYEYKSELPLFNLFKMHGSVDWKRTNLKEGLGTYKITHDSDLSIIRNIAKIEIADDDFTAMIDVDNYDDENKVIKTLSFAEILEETLSLEDKDIHDTFLNHYSDLIMINPTKDKFKDTTSNLYFYELLRMYSNHLEKENSVLFVLGFSFADEHIREITKRVLKSNPTLLVVIFCRKDDQYIFENMFDKANNIICLSPEEEKDFYSLDIVNAFLFEKLANELRNTTTPEKSEIEQNNDSIKNEKSDD